METTREVNADLQVANFMRQHNISAEHVMQPASEPTGESARMRGESDKSVEGTATGASDDWARRYHQWLIS